MSADSAATVDQLLLEQLETAELPTDAYDLLLSVVLGQSDQTPSPPTADLAPLAAYLSRIEVRGFRGIGEPATLDLVPGPGLTVVTGRNGSGKSTFAEAAELTLTGDEPSWARQGPQ